MLFVLSLFRRIIMRTQKFGSVRLSSECNERYDEAIQALNTLQSNPEVIEKLRLDRERTVKNTSIPDMIEMAARAGVTLEDIDSLAIVHISGTKGKGSTCAFTESLLRQHGKKTGFYSSPHLVEVRERIRINGKPISKEKFAQYFWDCFNKLESTKVAHEGKMPSYFRFLTIMAYHVFLQEQVDVAIIEVGIGGEYDSTNIVQKPRVCGVTSLGYDHMSILGHTLDQIAWNKGGIFKPGVPAVTIDQPENSIEVLKGRAAERQCPLFLAPVSTTTADGQPVNLLDGVNLGIAGDTMKLNACLALQLSHLWLQAEDKDGPIVEPYQKGDELTTLEPRALTPAVLAGLSSCRWPGRSQVIQRPGLTYYIDGAHTQESMECCSTWFKDAAQREAEEKNVSMARVLLFNISGDREAEKILTHLTSCAFDCVIFCPNIACREGNVTDQCNYTVSIDSQLSRCIKNKNVWYQLTQSHSIGADQSERSAPGSQSGASAATNQSDSPGGLPSDEAEPWAPHVSQHYRFTLGEPEQSLCCVFPTIEDALLWVIKHCELKTAALNEDAVNGQVVEARADANGVPEIELSLALLQASHIQLLCTGSLHLVGGLLGLVEPELEDL